MTAPRLSYLGWSGFRLDLPGEAVLYIDPPPGTLTPHPAPVCVLLTHGHPEHIDGTRELLAGTSGGTPLTVTASTTVCRYLARRYAGAGVRLRPVHAGERVQLTAGVRARVFGWRHLPLLPPGRGASVQHVRQLASRPGLALRIVARAMAGPLPGAMLGFDLDVAGARIIAWGEGLHRRCTAAEVAAITGEHASAVLLAGVEPGDEQAIGALLRTSGAHTAVLYEPHALWRDAFGMPRAALESLRRTLDAAGIHARRAERELPLPLSPAGRPSVPA